jgi:hypothetical protein
MNRADAQDLCERLAREHPERATHTWIAREGADGDWQVLKVAIPGRRREPLAETTEAKPAPPQPDDPRPSIYRNIPPFGPG